jgi:Tfp pilus assembly protein FimT
MQVSRKKQQGISLVGLIFVAAVLGVVGVFGAQIVPSFMEYRAIKNSIAFAKASGGSVQDMRSSFDKNADVGYIKSIAGRDLMFSRDNGNIEISFAYERKFPIFLNATLLIDYSGTTDPSGVVPEPAPEPK